MKLLYGEDKFFIGAVKFYDEIKDFGFIASNNCNMDVDEYNQDFYFNSDSFVDSDVKEERRIVVFQIEKRGTRTRAVNVRKFSKSDKDIELALSYYDEHEVIKLKDYNSVNVINSCGIPSLKLVPFIKSIIENNENRSTENTYNIFSSMVSRFKTKYDISEKYIFDRDYESKTKEYWQSLFNILKEDEALEILKHYPSTVKYLNNTSIIEQWLSPTSLKDRSIQEIQETKIILENAPKETLDIFKKNVEPVVVEKAKQRLIELSQKSNVGEKDIERELSKYLQFTRKKLLKEKKECLQQIQYNNFKEQKERYKRWKSAYEINDVLKAFSAIDNKTDEYIKELEETFKDEIEKYIESHKLSEAVSLISRIADVTEIHPKSYCDRLFPEIRQILINYCNNYKTNPEYHLGRLYDNFYNLTSILDDDKKKSLEKEIISLSYNCVLEYCENYKNDSEEIDKNLFDIYHSISSFLEEDKKNEFKNEILKTLRKTSSIKVISTLTDGWSKDWLTKDEALNLSESIIKEWSLLDINKWIDNNIYNHYFYDDEKFKEYVVLRAIDLITNIKLFNSFNLESENNENMSKEEIIKKNCKFINNLYYYSKIKKDNQKWKDYLKTRDTEEWLYLSKYNVVNEIPNDITKKFISSLSLDDIDASDYRWYSLPALKNTAVSTLLTKSSFNSFDFITERVKTIEINEENIPLIVYLLELLSIGKPVKEGYYDYRDIKEWNDSFKNKLLNFRNTINDNPKLCAILYCIYFETKVVNAQSAYLKEVFEFLPPYLQIRCTKFFFCKIAEDKLKKNAESLYNFLCKEESKLCLPLEITFEYLKLREKDPTSTLKHNIMLQLLDERTDHEEWKGIRYLTTVCQGRTYIDNFAERKYDYEKKIFYNGIIEEDRNTKNIILFVPYKMINEDKTPQNYNNKYYNYINEFIKISFSKDDYQFAPVANGTSYIFMNSCKMELLNMSRSFKILYNSTIHELPIIKQEEYESFCECRLSDKLDNRNSIPFYWCSNKPCFRDPIRYMTTFEWENYTILDFLRILNIPVDYISKNGKRTKFGYYIILSSYLKSFAKFYDHLKCRKCNNLMKPIGVTNYASRAVNEYACTNEKCEMHGVTIYLNHCFNKSSCDATIDSRDSKQCPNGQYICPECDACCSTENFRLRLENLNKTGGVITPWLENFVKAGLGHWEKNEFYCYRCGTKKEFENGEYVCKHCKDEIKPTIYNLF